MIDQLQRLTLWHNGQSRGQGVGLHGGQNTRCVIHPAEPDSGYQLRVGGQQFILGPELCDGAGHCNRVRIGGQVGVVGHIHVGDGATLSAQSGIMNDVPAGEQFTGTPARRHREMLEQWALAEALGKTRKRLRELEKRLAALEKNTLHDGGKQES